MYLPARYNVDLRYTRAVPLWNNIRAEVVGEFKNIFNTVQTQSVTSVITTDALGNATVTIPSDAEGFRPSGGFEQRQFQLGFRVRF